MKKQASLRDGLLRYLSGRLGYGDATTLTDEQKAELDEELDGLVDAWDGSAAHRSAHGRVPLVDPLPLGFVDEANRRVRPGRIMRRIERTGSRALIALIGVQSNQYPRAVDIARAFRARG